MSAPRPVPVRHTPRRIAVALVAMLPHTSMAGLDPFGGLAPVGSGQLERLRGGFDARNGLQFSFAIERAVVINGELVATTRLVLNDLTPLLTGGRPDVQLLGAVRDIVQNGLGNFVAPPPGAIQAQTQAAIAQALTPPAVTSPPVVAAANAAPAASPPATLPASPPPVVVQPAVTPPPATPVVTAAPPAPGVATVTPPAPAPVAATVTAPAVAPLLIQRQAGGQTILLPNAGAIVTAVQNTVNNQMIETRTTIDAVLSSISALRASTLAETVRQQALDGLRRP